MYGMAVMRLSLGREIFGAEFTVVPPYQGVHIAFGEQVALDRQAEETMIDRYNGELVKGRVTCEKDSCNILLYT